MPSLNRSDNRANGFGIVVSRQAHQDVDFADADQLANEIIGEEGSPLPT